MFVYVFDNYCYGIIDTLFYVFDNFCHVIVDSLFKCLGYIVFAIMDTLFIFLLKFKILLFKVGIMNIQVGKFRFISCIANFLDIFMYYFFNCYKMIVIQILFF